VVVVELRDEEHFSWIDVMSEVTVELSERIRNVELEPLEGNVAVDKLPPGRLAFPGDPYCKNQRVSKSALYLLRCLRTSSECR
jgi:hypothetical protein